MAKGTSSFDYRVFASYLLPKDILKYFDVTNVEEEHMGKRDETGQEVVILHVYLDELDNRGNVWHDLQPNGFTESRSVTDFPVRDHKVILHIRRRRWKDSEGHNVVLDIYDLVASGTSYSKEFADVLKKISRYLPVDSVFPRKVL